jgi:hypothetical protein
VIFSHRSLTAASQLDDIFIINELVFFIAAQHGLEPVGQKDAAAILNVPVSRFLLLLPQRIGG